MGIRQILGENSSNNPYDSTEVTANRDGSVLERLEDLRSVAGTLLGQSQIRFQQSEEGPIDEDGGRYSFDVGIVDIDTGEVSSANIDIATATVTLEKSTAGGAFSTAGITQPTIAKATGLVTISADLLATEWAVGDRYKVTLKGVKATDSGGTVNFGGPFVWTSTIVEDLDVKTTVDDIDADLGEPTDAATAAENSGGTVLSKVRDLGTKHQVPAADAATNAYVRDVAGNKSDAATTTVGTDKSLMAYLKGTINQLAKIWKREAVTTFSNAALGTTETTILDKGADAGADAFRLEGTLVNLAALGTGTTTVKFRIKGEINGVLTTIHTVDKTGTGAFDLLKDAGAHSFANRHVIITVQRNEGSGTDGSVSATVETSKST